MKLEEAIALRARLAARGVSQPDLVGIPFASPARPWPTTAAPRPDLEERFAAIWRELRGPRLEREFRFHPERRWRADFAHLPSKTIFELDGAVWGSAPGVRGGHDGAGRIRDCEKALAAWLLGYTVVRLVPGQITAENLSLIIAQLGIDPCNHESNVALSGKTASQNLRR